MDQNKSETDRSHARCDSYCPPDLNIMQDFGGFIKNHTSATNIQNNRCNRLH